MPSAARLRAAWIVGLRFAGLVGLGGGCTGTEPMPTEPRPVYEAPPVSPSDATIAAARALPEGCDAVLFVAPRTPERAALAPYFEQLGAATGLTARVADHAVNPALAEALKVDGNRQAAFRCGDRVERLSLPGKDPGLDADVAAALTRLAHPGGTEAGTTAEPLRKIEYFSDPPPLAITPETPLTRVDWADAHEAVSLERRSDAAGAYIWVTVGPPSAAPERSQKASSAAVDLLGTLAPLHALRELLPEDIPAPEVLGFAPPFATLSLQAATTTTLLTVGTRPYRSNGRFVHEDARVHLLDGHLLAPLEFVGPLFERHVQPLRLPELTELRVTDAGATRAFTGTPAWDPAAIALAHTLADVRADTASTVPTPPAPERTVTYVGHDATWALGLSSGPKGTCTVASSWLRATIRVTDPKACAAMLTTLP